MEAPVDFIWVVDGEFICPSWIIETVVTSRPDPAAHSDDNYYNVRFV